MKASEIDKNPLRTAVFNIAKPIAESTAALAICDTIAKELSITRANAQYHYYYLVRAGKLPAATVKGKKGRKVDENKAPKAASKKTPAVAAAPAPVKEKAKVADDVAAAKRAANAERMRNLRAKMKEQKDNAPLQDPSAGVSEPAKQDETV